MFIISLYIKICSCDSDEDIEVADEEINEVEEVENQADNNSRYIEYMFVIILKVHVLIIV